MDVERVSVFKVGKELSYVLKSGTIIGDCIIRQAKFYSDERYILVLRKTTGNALTNKFNTDHDFTLSTPSWFLEDNKTKSLTNRNSGKALYGMYYSTLNVKIQKSKKMDLKFLNLQLKLQDLMMIWRRLKMNLVQLVV